MACRESGRDLWMNLAEVGMRERKESRLNRVLVEVVDGGAIDGAEEGPS